MDVKEEQDEYDQQVWLTRSARQRQDLSLSVEEALDDPILQELFWSDEDDEPSSASLAQPEKGIFPPRLSLQSRTIRALHAGREGNDLVAQDESAALLHADGSSEAAGKRSPTGYPDTTSAAHKAGDTSSLLRFAQRLTSSFSVRDIAVEHEQSGQTGPLHPLFSAADHQAMQPFMGQKASSLAAIADIEVCTASTTGELSSREIVREFPPASELHTYPYTGAGAGSLKAQTSQTGALARVRPSERSQQITEAAQKKRLAGRSTRVRLEVVPKQSARQAEKVRPSQVVEQKQPEQQALPEQQELPIALQSLVQASAQSVQSALSTQTNAELAVVLPPHRESVQITKTQIPAIVPEVQQSSEAEAEVAYKGMLDIAARGALSGTGFFADGQSDVTVANSHVTEHSVVLITLTSNPGPVVVQYITLQPQYGFTVHLTAPTTMRASFNYIVLLGELF